jgi:opacity protein-like surface antigen
MLGPALPALRTWNLRSCLAGALLFSAAPIYAQTSNGAAVGWTFEFTPYIWGSAMKGDTQAANFPRTNVDMSFSDVLDVLDFALMGAFEARKGRLGVYLDAIYIKASDAATASRSGPGPIGATLTATADAKLEQTMLAVAGMYRLTEANTPVDLLAGVRYTDIEIDATIGASLFARSGVVDRSRSKDWFDPYIGLRAQLPIANHWKLVGYADVGGFGVGSDLTWQYAAGINYEFSSSMNAKFGYRRMRIDYDKKNFLYDMKLEGLYFGLGIRF